MSSQAHSTRVQVSLIPLDSYSSLAHKHDPKLKQAKGAIEEGYDLESQNSGVNLGKRKRNMNFASSAIDLRNLSSSSSSANSQCEDHFDEFESSERREKRLIQNRKSAKKCRQKKKVMFSQLQNDVMRLSEENKSLREKVNDITLMLYKKIDENSGLQRKLEQAQLGQAIAFNMIHQQGGIIGPAAPTSVSQIHPNATTAAQSNQLIGLLSNFNQPSNGSFQQGLNMNLVSQLLSLIPPNTANSGRLSPIASNSQLNSSLEQKQQFQSEQQLENSSSSSTTGLGSTQTPSINSPQINFIQQILKQDVTAPMGSCFQERRDQQGPMNAEMLALIRQLYSRRQSEDSPHSQQNFSSKIAITLLEKQEKNNHNSNNSNFNKKF